MCGIIGYSGKEISQNDFLLRLEKIALRGKDSYGVSDGESTIYDKNIIALKRDLKCSFFLGHALHAIVDFVPQPYDGCFVANCEIYNWRQLAKKYNLLAKNDAALLYLLLKKNGLAAIKELDGDYAFIWRDGESISAVRDIIGVKPLWWHKDETGIWLASENKALHGKGQLLDPRKIIIIQGNNITFQDRPFFTRGESKASHEEITERITVLLVSAVQKRINGLNKIAILFSGGVDSTLLAALAKRIKETGGMVTLYTAGFESSKDVLWARKIAKMLGIPHKIALCNLEELENQLNEVIPIIESTDVMKVGVALPFHLACKLAAVDGHKVILSGLGSEEIFAGYRRHKEAKDVNEECLRGLLSMHERDLYRDDTITMAHQLELRVPFLDNALIDYALTIPGDCKLKDGQDKVILREVALRLGVPKEAAYRKKCAAQYGSGIDKAIEKLAKRKGYKTKKDYLVALGDNHV